MKTSFFKLEWTRRHGGNGKTEREYLDYTIDGLSLKQILKAEEMDVIGRFGWGVIKENNKSVEKFLLRDEPDCPNARFMLYVCPECGDIGCGAITAVIEKSGDLFVWRDFAFENDYEKDGQSFEKFRGIGPFYFEKLNYLNELKRAKQKI